MYIKQGTVMSIDESGISSKTGYSTYVCIYIEYINYEQTSESILKLEKDLIIQHIHWSEMPWTLRIKLAKKLIPIQFKIRAVIYNNPVLPEKVLGISFTHLLLEANGNDRLLIDGKKTKSYMHSLKKILRDRGIKIYNFRIVNDKSEPIVRLTDFIAGAIRSFLDNPNGKHTAFIYNTFKGKIVDLYNIKSPDIG